MEQSKIGSCPYHRALLQRQALKAKPGAGTEGKCPVLREVEVKVPLDQVTKTVKKHADNPAQALKELHAKYGSEFEVETENGNLRFDHSATTARAALTATDGRVSLFKKSDSQSHGLARVLGRDNLLLQSGDNWESSREAMKDFFSPKSMNSPQKVGSIQGIMDKHLSGIEAEVEANGSAEIDLNKVFQKATLDVALTTLFSKPPSDEQLTKLSDAYAVVNERVGKEWILPASITGLEEPEKKFQTAVGTIKSWAADLVAERSKEPVKDVPDALGALMKATDPDTGEPYSKERLESEVLNLMLAGHETTSNLITWVLSDLARAPMKQNQIVSEIREQFGEKGDLSPKGIKKLPTLLKTWRQEASDHPPNYLLAREAVADTALGTKDSLTEVKKGTTIIMSTEHINAEDKGMFSFGAGRRFCLGAQLARNETEIAVTRFLQKFEITDTGERGVHSGLTQIPEDTLVTVHKRQSPHT